MSWDDRFGGPAAWDAHCERAERERAERLRGATCGDCGHFEDGTCGLDGEPADAGDSPEDAGCDGWEAAA